jgi:hypothetical protein
MSRLLLVLFSTVAIAAAQPKALFCMIETPNSVKSFTEHADKIDILVPALVLGRWQRPRLGRSKS